VLLSLSMYSVLFSSRDDSWEILTTWWWFASNIKLSLPLFLIDQSSEEQSGDLEFDRDSWVIKGNQNQAIVILEVINFPPDIILRFYINNDDRQGVLPMAGEGCVCHLLNLSTSLSFNGGIDRKWKTVTSAKYRNR